MSWSFNSGSSRRVSNFSDLIQRVTASCLLHPLSSQSEPATCPPSEEEDEEATAAAAAAADGNVEAADGNESCDSETSDEERNDGSRLLEMLTWQAFDAVSDLKRAYGALQAAHSPWDADRIRVADAAVVAEIRRLGTLRERFQRTTTGGTRSNKVMCSGAKMREVVAPYEAAVEELKRELKAKQAEIDNLKAKVACREGRKGRSDRQFKRKVALYSSTAARVTGSPAPELFESTMSSVIKASKSFTAVLLSLMRSANWDLAAAARSVQSATSADPNAIPAAGPHHARHAMESYVTHKMFQGFDHETFYMDGSLSSLIDPLKFRENCFSRYRDMQEMDPAELLGILPNCPFGTFCSKKYLEILHAKMEESLFGGDLEQRRQVAGGSHPRTQFYGEFLALAKAVWMLHLLAFSLDPSPTRFEAAPGAEFQTQIMENVGLSSSVVGREIVGFALTPGFKLGNGSIIKARVCLVPKAS